MLDTAVFAQTHNPLDWIPNPLDWVPNPLDWLPSPFEWLDAQLRELIVQFGEFVEGIIANPPRPEPGEWQNYMFANSLGWAETLSYMITVILFGVAIVSRRHMYSALQSFINLALLVGLGGYFYGGFDWAIQQSDRLTKSFMDLYEPVAVDGGGGLFWLVPSVFNLFGSIVTGFIVMVLGGIIMVVFFVFQLLIIYAKLTILPAFAFMALKGRGKKFVDGAVSNGLWVMVAPMAAILSMEVGQASADHLPGGSNPIAVQMYIIASLILALWSLKKTKDWTEKVGVNVVNSLATTSTIMNKVQTSSTERPWATMGSINSAHGAGTKPAVQKVSIVKPSIPKRIGKEAVRQSAQAIASKAAAGSSAFPAVAAGVYLVGRALAATHQAKPSVSDANKDGKE